MYRILFFLFWASTTMAQTINGYVYDERKEPLYGANIYFEGTTMGTTSDANGYFELHLTKAINTPLVIRFLGYETKIIESLDNSGTKHFLTPKANQLKEVKVMSQMFTRAEKLKLFKEQFLGMNKAGKSCVILNEEAIDLFYDNQMKTLSASSLEPLKIRNNLLKYEIDYDLHGFTAKFFRKSMKSTDVTECFYYGTSVYKDVKNPKDSIQISKLRDKSYLGSRNHFFRNLIHNKWDKKNFLFFHKGFIRNANSYFYVQKKDQAYEVELLDKEAVYQLNGVLKTFGSYNVLYNNKEQSAFQLKTNQLHVDDYGNINQFDKIVFGGEIGKKRLGDLLPVDYLPEGL